MRICFDRLCFSNRKPANDSANDNDNDNDNASGDQIEIRTNANQSETGQVSAYNADLSTASPKTISTRASVNFSPDQVELATSVNRDNLHASNTPAAIQIIPSSNKSANYSSDSAIIFTSASKLHLKSQSSKTIDASIDNQSTQPLIAVPKNSEEDHGNCVIASDAVLTITCSSTTSTNTTTTTLASTVASQTTIMQHDPNANIQFQPDLGLVNNSSLPVAYSGGGAPSIALDNNSNTLQLALPLQTSNDVLTHTLIYGTVPSSVQQLHTDPDIQTRNILQQQEIQLQHRFQQLQQLQAQTQGLFAGPSQVTLPAPIVIQQPTAGVAPTHTIYTGTPTDFCAQQKILTNQMQALCLSGATGNPSTATSVPMSSTVFEASPTVSAVNFLNNSYVPATAQEERLIQMLQAKDLKIQEMQRALQYKDTEIAELKSHLDKFQSVFPFSRSGASTPSGFMGSANFSGLSAAGATAIDRSDIHKSGPSFQRQRAQGISAEPQSESSVLLDKVTFPKYEKDER